MKCPMCGHEMKEDEMMDKKMDKKKMPMDKMDPNMMKQLNKAKAMTDMKKGKMHSK